MTLFVAALLAGCGSSSKNDDEITTPVRFGETLPGQNGDPQFIDRAPVVSADGTTAFFLSHRAGDHRKAQLFRKALATPDADPVAAVADANIGTVLDYALSPSGDWLVFVATADAGTAVWAQNARDAAVAPQRIDAADDADLESGVALSAGAQPFLAYTVTHEGKTSVRVSRLGADGAWEKPTALAGEGEMRPAWIVDGASTRLVTMRRKGATQELVSRAVTDPAQAATATAAVWREGLDRLAADTLVASDAAVAYAMTLPRNPPVIVNPESDKTDLTPENTRKIVVQSRAVVLAPGADPKILAGSRQSSVRAVSVNHDASLALTLGNENFDCKARFDRGSTLVLHDVATGANVRLDLRANAAGNGWDLVNNPCDFKTADGKDVAFNRSFGSARLAPQSRPDAVTVVFDILENGSPEVYQLSFAWEPGKAIAQAQLVNVSRNGKH